MQAAVSHNRGWEAAAVADAVVGGSEVARKRVRQDRGSRGRIRGGQHFAAVFVAFEKRFRRAHSEDAGGQCTAAAAQFDAAAPRGQARTLAQSRGWPWEKSLRGT